MPRPFRSSLSLVVLAALAGLAATLAATAPAAATTLRRLDDDQLVCT